MDLIARVAQDTSGNVISGATVTVYIGDSMSLASIYSDAAGSSGKPNPFTTGPFGDFVFYAPDELYRIEVTVLDGMDVVEMGTIWQRLLSPENILQRLLNGSDIQNKPLFRTNLGLTSAATGDASGLTSGTLPIERLPALPGSNYVFSSGDIADLTVPQQDAIAAGTLVTTTDGRRWQYSGAGDKLLEASYIQLADITPLWAALVGIPTNVLALAGLVLAADKGLYATAPGVLDQFDLTPFARTVLAEANAAGARAALSAEEFGAAAAAIAAHVAMVDPHPQYLTQDEADDLYDPLGAAVDEVDAHVADVDPHGDRAYTDSEIAALGLGTASTANTEDFDPAGEGEAQAEAYTNAKAEIVALTPIPDPTTATAEDCANKINEIIAALQAPVA